VKHLWLAFTLALAFGCGSDPVIVTPRALDHAGRVSFICLDSTRYRAGDPLVPFDSCVAPPGATVPSNFVLHALVTQETRGEIAAIDLTTDQILDSQRVVPGFTFEPVGELPSAMAVPTVDPTFTYVSNFGQLDIFARATRRFLPEARRGGDLGSLPSTFTCLVGSPVADLILSPDETTLYATLPERGSILEIPLTPWDPDVRQSPFGDDDCSVRREIPLTDMIPFANAAEPRADHCLSCPETGCAELVDPFPVDDMGVPQPSPPRDPATAIGMVPRPLRLSLDEDNELLLVADERLPLVHVLDLQAMGGAMPLEPLNVGTPTQHIVVTPAVPLTPGEDMQVATERFMYGIDGIDRSVFAADYTVDEVTRQPSVAIIPVSVRTDQPKDRLQLGPGARVLEVIVTPEYQVDPGTGQLISPPCSTREVAASTLRGVFLSVGSNDGNVYVVDVYDLDAPCRLGTAAVCDGEVPGIVRRHRIRVAQAFEGGVKATSGPSFIISSGSTVTVEEDGTTLADPSPRVIPFEGPTCPGTISQGKLAPSGDDANALVCGLRDPWAVVPENWLATWEGSIPGTRGGRGRFSLEGGEVVFDAEVPFCSRGVLGGDNVASLVDEPESGYPGDLLVVVGDVPTRPESDPIAECCTTLFGGEDALVQLIDPTIQHASQDRLVIRSPRTEIGLPDACVEQSLTDIFVALTTCFDELVTYEVRARDSYAVEGSITGFPHRVVEDVDGSCAVDVMADPLRQGRAVNGTLYDNGTVSFTLDSALGIAYPARGDDLAFSFAVGDTPTQLVLPGGTLLNDLRFSEADGNLYSVDIGGLRGLARFTLDPFERAQTFE